MDVTGSGRGVGEGRSDVGHALHVVAQLAATLVEADASEDIAKREDVARGEAVKPLVEGAGVKAVVLADVVDLEISAHGEVEDEVDTWSREQREEVQRENRAAQRRKTQQQEEQARVMRKRSPYETAARQLEQMLQAQAQARARASPLSPASIWRHSARADR